MICDKLILKFLISSHLLGRVFDPDLMILEKAIQLIASLKFENLHHLVCGDAALPISLKQSSFKNDTRRITTSRDNQMDKLIRNFYDNLHVFKPNRSQITNARHTESKF